LLSVNVPYICCTRHEKAWLVAHRCNWKCKFPDLGPVSRSPRKIFEPKKPFLVNQCSKTKKCMCLKLLVRNETSVFIKNMWINQPCSHNVWDFAMAFWVRKIFGTFEKRAPDVSFEWLISVAFIAIIHTDHFLYWLKSMWVSLINSMWSDHLWVTLRNV